MEDEGYYKDYEPLVQKRVGNQRQITQLIPDLTDEEKLSLELEKV